MKILILKPSSLGDVIQALPVLRLLKRHDPANEIYWWIGEDLQTLLEDDPDLTGLILFRRQLWKLPQHWPALFASIRQTRTQQFDVVLDLQGLARSGAFAWLADGQLLIGLDDPREGARGFYDVIVRRPSFHTHAVDWYLETLKVLGVPVHGDFSWLPPRAGAAGAIRQKWRPDSARWIIINPGARWPNKRWPLEHYAELIRQLASAHAELRFAILGGGSDRSLGEHLAQTHLQRCLDLTGRTSLPEMVEWVRLSELMVTNDTGPMHVAAALNKPVVALFGPTEPRRTGPYRQQAEALRISLPCAPCLKSVCRYEKPLECLRAIPPARVRERVERLLRG